MVRLEAPRQLASSDIYPHGSSPETCLPPNRPCSLASVRARSTISLTNGSNSVSGMKKRQRPNVRCQLLDTIRTAQIAGIAQVILVPHPPPIRELNEILRDEFLNLNRVSFLHARMICAEAECRNRKFTRRSSNNGSMTSRASGRSARPE